MFELIATKLRVKISKKKMDVFYGQAIPAEIMKGLETELRFCLPIFVSEIARTERLRHL